MQRYNFKNIVRIIGVKTNGDKYLIGSGSLVIVNDNCFVSTNEHVTRKKESYRLIVSTYDELEHNVTSLVEEIEPVDSSLIGFNSSDNYISQSISTELINNSFQCVKREVLFFNGYAESNSKQLSEPLLSNPTPYLGQLDEDKIPYAGTVEIGYRTELATMIKPNDKPLPLPPGLSGSLVWNTNFVNCLKLGLNWSPAYSRVVGQLKRWKKGSNTVIVNRIENINFLSLYKNLKEYESNI